MRLPSATAIRASKKIQHLKSPDKPNAVLLFLRQTGMSESDIRTSISRYPRILCSSVENNWRPNVAKLQKVGISIEDIACIISHSPGLFKFNFVPKVDFWMQVLGLVENLSMILKRGASLLHSSLENVIMPNLSFLEEQCGLIQCQTVQLIKLRPRFITSRTEALKMKVKSAEELGVGRSSQMFVYALVVVSSLKKDIIDARLNNLKTLGFSQEEVTTLVSTNPMVLNLKEETMCSKRQFLIKDAGCDMLHLVRDPVLLTLSLEKQLIPHSLVLKLVESKGLPVPKSGFLSFARQNEKQFLKKIVLSYEHSIPGLHRAYTDAVSGSLHPWRSGRPKRSSTSNLLISLILCSVRETNGHERIRHQNSISRYPLILCSSVENNLRPNVAKLQKVGISIEDIACIVSHSPGLFKFNFVGSLHPWQSGRPKRSSTSNLLISLILCSVRETNGHERIRHQNSISRYPLILCSSVENNLRPNVAKLQKVGISIEDIACIVSHSPGLFKFNFVPKVDFWMRVLGSVENLSMILKRGASLLQSSLENVIMTNLSFLEEQCGLIQCQIVQLIKLQPRFITSRTEALKMKVKSAEELGVVRSSQMFVYALVVVSGLKKDIIDARLNNLKTLGFSQEEVTILVSTNPMVLNLKEETMCSKIQFLIKDAGCDMLHLVRDPVLLMLSLEKRLIPRSLVLKLVKSKGLPVPKSGFLSFARQNEKQFLKKIVLSYEHAIPGLHRAYTDAVSGLGSLL